MKSDLWKITTFGPVIYSYTRSQAVADGFEVEVSKVAREAGITYQVFLTRAVFDNYVAVRQLKPRPWNTRLTVALTFDEARRVVRPERLPSLVPCHLRQRTIAAQRRGIATQQPAKKKSRRRQGVWKAWLMT